MCWIHRLAETPRAKTRRSGSTLGHACFDGLSHRRKLEEQNHRPFLNLYHQNPLTAIAKGQALDFYLLFA